MRYSLEGTIDKTVLAEFTTPSRRTSQQLTVYTGVPTFKNQCRIHRVLRAGANARHTRYTRSKIKRRYATVSRERLEEKRTDGASYRHTATQKATFAYQVTRVGTSASRTIILPVVAGSPIAG